MCFYGISLLWSFNASTLLEFKFCYSKCIKRFFGYNKYDSTTAVLMELYLPTANTVLLNYRCLCLKPVGCLIVTLLCL